MLLLWFCTALYSSCNCVTLPTAHFKGWWHTRRRDKATWKCTLCVQTKSCNNRWGFGDYLFPIWIYKKVYFFTHVFACFNRMFALLISACYYPKEYILGSTVLHSLHLNKYVIAKLVYFLFLIQSREWLKPVVFFVLFFGTPYVSQKCILACSVQWNCIERPNAPLLRSPTIVSDSAVCLHRRRLLLNSL